ncbi:RNA polymerase sigma factor [Spirochaeta thermophila]|uniref:HTH luxR-type domain-containing protein n=1 Tax=Winmispira thermophila (strain ATCC 49972 / DSM 6192 / RI 19.B1) TaxID=665571 RepID=E0RPH8_WINT6|nr:RNA polymerase sigma factor [Spirochaeta thermophila]ADN02760.1 hypothetical protein STHERM_c18250 [Spirochaeta thermophila DSM 6192]
MYHDDGLFDRVYRHAFPVLYRVVYRITGDGHVAEEICQEAFIRYYPRMHKIQDTDEATYWLIRVARNLAYNHERRRTRERRALTSLFKEQPKVEESEESRLLKEEDSRMVRDAIMALPYNLRVPLVLREYEGFAYQEIAKALGISEANVKIRIFRARRRLAELLEDRGMV